jgi:hypothetical protein
MFKLAAILVAAVALSSCGDSPEKLAQDYCAQKIRITKRLGEIFDKGLYDFKTTNEESQLREKLEQLKPLEDKLKTHGMNPEAICKHFAPQ